MNYRYLINPKNPNLHPFVQSYLCAFNNKINSDENQTEKINKLNVKSFLHILTMILGLKSDDRITLIFFSTQIEYILILSFLRFIANILSKDLKLIHLMHEPRYEKGRTSQLVSSLLYISNWTISSLVDKVIIPSEEGMNKAQTFIKPSKLCQINLAFESNKEQDLLKYLNELKFRWNLDKTFSLIGIAAPDRNPDGFIRLANEVNKNYANCTKFIRAGRDKDVNVDYRSENVITFPGYVTNEAKSYLTSQSHFVVIPYFFSTNSAVIPESLSYGKLLIVNDIPAFSYLKGRKFALVIDFSDQTQVIECVKKIFSLSADEYESSYLDAINFFKEQHSQIYLVDKLDKFADI